jgi:surfeit locus 1 family protein
VPIKLGSRIFAPRVFTTLLTLGLLVLLVSLGRWQLRRAEQQRGLFDAFAAGTDSTLALDAGTPRLPRFQHVEATGHYDQERQVLIDNMTSADGRAGYFVLTPFALAGGGWLLINRGWVPLGRSRAERPDLAVAETARTLRGRTDHLPSPGIRMGHPAAPSPPFPVVATYPSVAELSGLLHDTSWSKATDIVLLDADQPDGYLRQWAAPGFPPIRHLAYAVQWFGLALTLAVIYVVTNFRRAAAAGIPGGVIQDSKN